MTQNQQNQIWIQISKDMRQAILAHYNDLNSQAHNPSYSKTARRKKKLLMEGMESIFGHDNLTSDKDISKTETTTEEPKSEIKVGDTVKIIKAPVSFWDTDPHIGDIVEIGTVYDDKYGFYKSGNGCMVYHVIDKDCVIPYTVKPKPEYKSGDKARITKKMPNCFPTACEIGDIVTVLQYDKDKRLVHIISEKCPMSETYPDDCIEPYIEEPKIKCNFNVGDRVVTKTQSGKLYIGTALDKEENGAVWIEYDGAQPKESDVIVSIETISKPDPQTTDNMEENNIAENRNDSQYYDKSDCKELNLGKLLANAIGEDFFSPTHGKATLKEIGDICMVFEIDGGCTITAPSQFILETGFVFIYPSRELFSKYPLDAQTAWQVWLEQRESKRDWWRAEDGGKYWIIDRDGYVFESTDCTAIDTNHYEFGNYFRDEASAQQAADLIRETLQKFHENQEKK